MRSGQIVIDGGGSGATHSGNGSRHQKIRVEVVFWRKYFTFVLCSAFRVCLRRRKSVLAQRLHQKPFLAMFTAQKERHLSVEIRSCGLACIMSLITAEMSPHIVHPQTAQHID